MTPPRSPTRFGGSTGLHYVTITSPLCRDPKLISRNMAVVLAMLDGLALVCSAASRVDGTADAPGASARFEIGRDPD